MSKIEWTDATWNPIAGCSDVSEGCRHCYARTMAGWLEAMGSAKYAGLTVLQGSHRVWTGKIAFDEAALLKPLRTRRPTRWFVNSMSDLFHPGVTDDQIDRIFAVMALCPQHTFQALTKRPERMLAYLEQVSEERDMQRWVQYIDAMAAEMKWTDWPEPEWPLPNVHLGVSVEDQKTADARIPLLLQTPAAVRFVSAEPLLGPVDLEDMVRELPHCEHHFSVLECDVDPADDEDFHGASVDWVIVGGESGFGARPMHPQWARSLRDQCVAAGQEGGGRSAGRRTVAPDAGGWVGGAAVSEVFFKREVLLAFPDARLVTIGKPHGQTGTLHRVVSKRAGYPLSGYKPEPKDAWAEAHAELPKGKAGAAEGCGMASLFGGEGV